MSTALKTPPVRGRAPPPRAAPPPQFGGKPPVPRRAPPPSRAIPPTPTRGPIPSFVPTGAPHVIKETPFANTNYMNAASAGKLAVHQKHLTADVAKKGEEELDTTFRVGLAKGAVDDMVLLSDVTNPGIVRNLLERYNEDKIYTYIGPVLISVNPFKRMSDVGPEFIKKYAGISKHDAPPHAYAVADHMYRRLIEDQYSQCVIISGESGAGKTEASKLIMNHIAACSGGGQEVSRIKSVILESNPLLEAFGNAKTIRNNNSSRFGKLLEIQFDRAGRPCGGIITNFLLEKSRVVGQLKNERNFHIFYQILCGLSPDDKTNLGLTTPEDFFVLNKTGCYTVEGVDDAAECADTLNAMNVVGLTSAEQQSIFLLLAAILHLGNVQFHEVQNNASAVSNQDYLDYAAMILGIDNAQLTTKLLSRTVKSGGGHRGSVYEVPLSAIKAAAARDALMKGIYSRIFDYIVEAVNKAMTNVSSRQSICILDIYGFEIFEKNGFEQFCINYVNEKLQQIFIELTIQSEQEDYEREGIQWTKINFFNNKTVCDLIESRKAPVGILSILDDVCKTMHNEGEGVDLKFLQKLNSISHAHFSPGTNTFRIKHYAGDVNYHCEGFVEKNKDVLFKDLVRIIQNSKVPFLAMLFENEDVSEDSRKAPTTAGFKIYTQAQSLVSKLKSCDPSYIRCIKPNDNKRANDFDEKRVEFQVKYLGLLENIKVRRAGFSYRGVYKRFIDRYAICNVHTRNWKGDPRKGSELLLQNLRLPPDEYRFGKTKIFLRAPETLFGLDDLRDRTINHYAGKIQRFYERHNPERRRIIEERVYWFQQMYNLFCNAASTSDFGKSLPWPSYQWHLEEAVNWAFQIYRNWWAFLMVSSLNAEQQQQMRQKIVSYDIFYGKKKWPCNRVYYGNYLALDQFYSESAAYRQAELELLRNSGEKCVIFSDVVQKVNKTGKSQNRAFIVTADHFYKYTIGKKMKILKKPISISAVNKVSLSPFDDTFIVIHMNAPERDLCFDLNVDKNNKVAEFVTMLYQSYFVINNKPLPVEFKRNEVVLSFMQSNDPKQEPNTSIFKMTKKSTAVVFYK